MELSKLFEMQKSLDERIIEEKGLEVQNLLPKKILALQVELAELANEWRGFKFWSENQQPRLEVKCHACKGVGKFADEICLYCEGTGIQSRPLLEEYVDCLHFFLSIANTIRLPGDDLYGPDENLIGTTENVFIEIMYYISKTWYALNAKDVNEEVKFLYFKLALHIFWALGEQRLGFDWEKDIAPAYLEKNAINHERQENGY